MRSTNLIASSLLEACATMAAALATMACAWWLAPGASTAVLAVVLTMSLSRSQLDRDLRGRLEAAVVLPVVGLLAFGVGMLLQRLPWVGATVFTVGMAVSIWLRRFGPMARRAGSLIALPFITLLMVPHVHPTSSHGLPAPLVPIIVALMALFWVTLAHQLLHWKRGQAFEMDGESPSPSPTSSPTPTPQPPSGLPASTRMALQMAVALALAFAVGYLFFPARWSWIVVTAFIVNAGNRGRIDVVHKSGMRVFGASIGTLAALALHHHLVLSPAVTGTLIFAALFMGMWLRPLSYAWWALFITMALALLQGFTGDTPVDLLLQRLEEIAIGAIIGIGAAWWVLPVRSTDVLRRRLATALAALSDALDPQQPQRNSRAFNDALDEVELLAPAFRLAQRFMRHPRARVPAAWLDLMLSCREPANQLIAAQAAPPRVRQAVGAARKALREPEHLLDALQQLRDALGTQADIK